MYVRTQEPGVVGLVNGTAEIVLHICVVRQDTTYRRPSFTPSLVDIHATKMEMKDIYLDVNERSGCECIINGLKATPARFIQPTSRSEEKSCVPFSFPQTQGTTNQE